MIKKDADKNLIFREGNDLYDFNLYKANLVNPYDQMYITPTGECYIVRESNPDSYLSHAQYAKKLVNSIAFAKREREELKNNPYAKSWQFEKGYYDPNLFQEWSYLVNEKGFILFSPPPYDGMEMPIPKDYFPHNLDLMTKQQINVFLNFYEFNGKMTLPKDLEQALYDKIVTKKKR